MARTKLTGYTDHVSVTEGDTVQFMVSAEGATAGERRDRPPHPRRRAPRGPRLHRGGRADDRLRQPRRRTGSSSTSARASTSTDPSGQLDLHGPDHDPRVHLPDDADEGPPGDPVALGDPRDGRLRARHQHLGAPGVLGRRRPRDRRDRRRGAAAAPHVVLRRGHVRPGLRRRPTIRQQAVVNPYNGRLGKVAPFDHTSRVRAEAAREAARRRAAVPLRRRGDAGRGPRHVQRAAATTARSTAAACTAACSPTSELDAHRGRRRAAGRRPGRPLGHRRPATATTASTTSSRDVGRTASHGHGVQPAGPRHDGLELGRQRGRLAARAGAVRRHPLPRRRPHGLPAGSRRSSWTVPADTRSGFYAARLTRRRRRGPRPVLRAPARSRRRRSCSSPPTNSYLAYANEMIVHDVPVAQAIVGHVPVLSGIEADYYQDPGVRPLDVRPPHRRRGRLLLVVAAADPEHAAQVPIVGDLDHVAVPARPVHHRLARAPRATTTTSPPTTTCTARASTLLRRYSVVLTGSHPEY